MIFLFPKVGCVRSLEGSFQGCIRIQGDGLSFEILNLPVEFPIEIDFIEDAWDARSIREWICHVTDLLSCNGIEGGMSIFSRMQNNDYEFVMSVEPAVFRCSHGKQVCPAKILTYMPSRNDGFLPDGGWLDRALRILQDLGHSDERHGSGSFFLSTCGDPHCLSHQRRPILWKTTRLSCCQSYIGCI